MTEKTAGPREEKTKEEYKALNRIECFIGILVEGEQIDVQESSDKKPMAGLFLFDSYD